MAPTPVSALASYKKKDGTLAMSRDGQSVSWTPKNADGTVGEIVIQVAKITNLQQTPVTSPKVMLKIFVQQPGAKNAAPGAPEQFVFSFTSSTNARAEADTIRDVLNAGIQAVKAAQSPAPGGQSAAMAIASAVTSAANGKPVWHDDNKLKVDAELQQSLLKSDSNLQRVFMESLRTKPDSVTSGQFMSQFWSSRIHLLRAHAIEKSQSRGSYNVLSSLKPRVENSVTRLNISKEQIQLIFNQHPLVKKVYDENVPKLTEHDFWSRFFQSRLFKKLRGERITESDATDALLDKYLRADEYADRHVNSNVPHMIDLEANEDNVKRHGNRPNFDMRPSTLDKVPIIRTLNNLSEKIMANVAPIDRDPSAPVGMDEETFNQLQLRDLRGDREQDRIILNIKDQSRFFAATKETENEEALIFSRQDPETILASIQKDLITTYPETGEGVPLSRLVEPEEDSDDDKSKTKSELVGSKSSLARASTQIFDAIRERKTQADSASGSDTCGLSQGVFDRLTLTHATTTEFLHQFWQAFLSGNPDRVGEIQSLVESLNRAMDRIKAVADEAEVERRAEVEKLKQHAREIMAATGKNIRPNFKAIEGGQKVVNQLMKPTMNALGKAISEYQAALAQQSKDAALVI
ncbi:RNA polymerase II transcription factor B subunit 1 [Ophidiomyces ophidiicola]|uniref:RNA polymerase II transcription factor B subunit 1 n=1 Tax=Ophidiomyces ophidiicola TaxID=1387563 RepID=A0ACB8UWC4_9EURO|nr:RNA polymerase II transcription factor B subunit 1 [Ophidiomyces ophidiicola]KAI1931237.1 RNA polymerase II transcription factor B subunit 1 [Ophidiomyces ophidiicola]KAI1956769.1 RNA polymerase II transcription factor B subunit 1 [Ophidiomyces ophidiicola]KAI1974611.1 RNA polymerase II transcription factor B subunit 1 [Ophidiomyces ophidiicola]KAI2032447.1 RNA polymerase II transcription factor B subunit 1 [Ophidiomyces ophidiicola]